MLSVVIEARNDEEGLARTLASLVSGAVEGVVREVIVCDLGSADHSHHVAEEAGCVWLAQGGAAAGVRHAKSDWVLLIEPGATLLDGWMESVARHVSRAEMAGRFSTARKARIPFFKRIFSGNRALVQGLLITKRQATSLSKTGQGGEAIARGLATKRLDGEIIPAVRK
ncbi:MAG: glycosyl transferase family 2 [Rhizobiaceae bacterium]|nr:glycosyl transferase family 2 [Rhizobiaceae bacterium]